MKNNNLVASGTSPVSFNALAKDDPLQICWRRYTVLYTTVQTASSYIHLF